MDTVATSDILRSASPATVRTGYAGQRAITAATFSTLDRIAYFVAALMALGPLAAAAYGAHFGA